MTSTSSGKQGTRGNQTEEMAAVAKNESVSRRPSRNLGLKLRARNRFGVPNGIRTRVAAVKGRCPGPLDDGDVGLFVSGVELVELIGIEPTTS